MSDRLDRQMAFLSEADRLKGVLRASRIGDGTRRENSAEHSWHLALYALILSEHAETEVDRDRVIRMLLIHDLVEIDAGDAPIFAGAPDPGLAEKEEAAAKRIFGLLPPDQAEEALALWLEFEAAESADARFAKSLDRFQPPNQNLANGGGTWVEYGVTHALFLEKVAPKINRAAPALWDWLAPRVAAFFAR
ncbi:HD domain-containing protein [Litorisediminicola beolgyonensis]|uniref:HD domain-containing protein n=1 Tax=Litorisediminicola beolgyonensis TaxID=1173614 RepID=A0ABW3ZLU9_9RHOB